MAPAISTSSAVSDAHERASAGPQAIHGFAQAHLRVARLLIGSFISFLWQGCSEGPPLLSLSYTIAKIFIFIRFKDPTAR